ARATEFAAERLGIPLVCQREHAGLPAYGLLKGEFGIVASRQRGDLKAVGIALDHTQSAAADRTRRTQDGDAFHAGGSVLIVRDGTVPGGGGAPFLAFFARDGRGTNRKMIPP